jgi:DNA repair photolyase
MDGDEFKSAPSPRKEILNMLARDAEKCENQGETRPVLFCFVTDPYQPLNDELQLTRSAIKILHRHGLRVTILTKGGIRAMRDFDLLGPQDAFATTLTLVNQKESEGIEPGAAIPWERILSLKEAHNAGIETWVSCEPILRLTDTLSLIDATKEFVGHYKIGTLNYHPELGELDWKKTAETVKSFMEEKRLRFYMKKDLARHIGFPDGYWGEVE